MPNDVKAVVSAVTLILAAILAFWSGSPIRPGLSGFVIVTAIFMVAAMWGGPASMVGGQPTGQVLTIEAPAPHAGWP